MEVFKELRKHTALYLMFLPGAIVVFLFSYLPMPGVLLAFKDYRNHGNIFESFMKSEWVGLRNFEFLFKSPDAFRITRNIVCYNLVFIILGIVVPVGVAIILNELLNKRMASFYQTTFFLPYFLSWVIISYLAFILFSVDHGVINNHLLIPLGVEPVAWYERPEYWPVILTIANMWKYTGYGSVVYLAAISSINEEYYEAATIDGASKLQQATKVTIPLLVPLMLILGILALGRIFSGDIGLFYLLPRQCSTLFPTTQIIDTYVLNALRSGDFPTATATGFYQAVVGCVLVLASNAVVRRVSKENALI